MKIAVLGTINHDTILSANGEKRTSLGGILYNVFTIAALAHEIEVYPVCWIGEEHHQEILNLLSPLQNVNTGGFRLNPAGTNENQLTYLSGEERSERLTRKVPPLSFEMIAPYLDSDLFLVNLISGFDLTLETLRQLRDKYQGILYLDLHSLTLGMDEKGVRYPQKVVNWRDWIQSCDFLQVNKRETALLLSRELAKREDFDEVGFSLLDHGPSIVNITFGEEGTSVFFRKTGVKASISFSGEKRGVKDTTGCGDVYGGGFIASYLQKGDPVEAAKFANRIAGLSTQFIGIEGLLELKNLTYYNSMTYHILNTFPVL
ncbi:carbohydrate kinase family protein [candidate division TA06 bacterium]|nr:carbohydrate kinase family protein [candidate division TA06 bacterium]